jgi:hypothetical protein
LALLFKVGGIVALERRQDAAEGVDPQKNAQALAEARRRLAAGGAVCLFPEGISHDLTQIQPLKTGAARIALEYVDMDGNPEGLKLIPVGIEYLDKDAFRSAALVRVAEPIDAGAWRASNPQAGPRELMLEVELRLRENTLNFERREESEALSFAAELALTEGREPVRIGEISGEAAQLISKIRELQQAYETLKEGQAAGLQELGGRILAFKARLKVLGLHPRELFLKLDAFQALRFTLREFSALFFGLPLAALGILGHLLPYLSCVLLKRGVAQQRDVRATYAIFGAFLLFPLYYAVCFGLIWHFAGLLPALACILALIVSGWAALRYRDRFLAVFKRSLAFLRFVLSPRLKLELQGQAQAILSEMARLSGLNGAAKPFM